MIMSEQKGVFRVNCIDCLDRTNVVQVVHLFFVLVTSSELMPVVVHSLLLHAMCLTGSWEQSPCRILQKQAKQKRMLFLMMVR
jgi:hypothetical protein